ncbi:MAG TPA: hypothetical protein VIN11_05275 [Roseivirga sp.]
MTEEQIHKINDIRNIEFESMDKNGLSDLCDLILGVWELEEDETVKMAISEKFNEIIAYLISRMPDS